MNVIEALNSRHSTRVFKPDPVAKDILLRALASANRAPSWTNTQPWEVFAVSGEPLERLRKAFLARFDQRAPTQSDLAKPQTFPTALQERAADNAARRFAAAGVDPADRDATRSYARNLFAFCGAPVVIYLCMNRGLNQYSLFDIGMFAQSFMLAALELGLDSFPAFCLVDHADLVRTELHLPEDMVIVLGIAVGHGVSDHSLNLYRSPRRHAEEMVRFEGW